MLVTFGDIQVNNGDTIGIGLAQQKLRLLTDLRYQVTVIREVTGSPDYVCYLKQVNLDNAETNIIMPYELKCPSPMRISKYRLEVYITTSPLPQFKFTSRCINLDPLIRLYRLSLIDSTHFYVSNP